MPLSPEFEFRATLHATLRNRINLSNDSSSFELIPEPGLSTPYSNSKIEITLTLIPPPVKSKTPKVKLPSAEYKAL